ncbi:MAG: hypothetical protein ABI534_08715 [Chloroflexota bacterium]
MDRRAGLVSLGRAIVENVVGLVVDDGLIVLGALAALAITGLLAAFAPAIPHELLGLLLFVLVAASLMALPLRAAHAAQRDSVGEG